MSPPSLLFRLFGTTNFCSKVRVYSTTHTHTHTHPFNGPLSRTTRASRYQKGEPIWILLKQETVSGSGISWAVCRSASRSREITTPAPYHSVFLQAGCPSCRPTNSVKALKVEFTRPKFTKLLPYVERSSAVLTSAWQRSSHPSRNASTKNGDSVRQKLRLTVQGIISCYCSIVALGVGGTDVE